MATAKIEPHMVMADAQGNIYDDPDLLMVCRRGEEWGTPRPDELMPLPEESDHEATARQRLLEINRCAARYFYENLNAQTEEAALARRYWKEKRGLSDAAIRRFGLGYAPDEGFGLVNYLKRRGFRDDELEHSGLIRRSERGNLYTIFRHRVMVPIIDVRGAIIAFGGRVLDDSKPLVTKPEQAYVVTQILEAIYRSAETNRPVYFENGELKLD